MSTRIPQAVSFLAYVTARNKAIGRVAATSALAAIVGLVAAGLARVGSAVAVCAILLLIATLLGLSWLVTSRLLTQAQQALRTPSQTLELSTWRYRGYRDPTARGSQITATLDAPDSKDRVPLADLRVRWTSKGLGQIRGAAEVYGSITKNAVVVVAAESGSILATIRAVHKPGAG